MQLHRCALSLALLCLFGSKPLSTPRPPKSSASPPRGPSGTSKTSRLFELLAETQGRSMPLPRDLGETYPTRKQGKAKLADFPTPLVKPEPKVDPTKRNTPQLLRCSALSVSRLR
jgi:hypothetical protein